jgi:hypothetical protein
MCNPDTSPQLYSPKLDKAESLLYFYLGMLTFDLDEALTSVVIGRGCSA